MVGLEEMDIIEERASVRQKGRKEGIWVAYPYSPAWSRSSTVSLRSSIASRNPGREKNGRRKFWQKQKFGAKWRSSTIYMYL